ncbi:MAG: STAS domain-containing protein [Planctomycetota bacterium]|jgi:ABC-type transporter Mla MlaB component
MGRNVEFSRRLVPKAGTTMITSYVSPEGSLIYLSLVGSLDRTASSDLLLEFDERVREVTRRCILDLSGVENYDPAGLDLVDRLVFRTHELRMRFSVAAGNSPVTDTVRARAGDAWLEVLPELPLSA